MESGVIKGAAASHPEGSYYIEWREDGVRRREPVADFSEVVDRARRKLIELEAMKEGIIEAKPVEIKETRVKVEDAITQYLQFIEGHRKKCTYLTYRYTLDILLRESCRRTYVDQVTREDILQFMTDCYRKKLGKRTVYDKLVVVLQMFKRFGMTRLLDKSDWPECVDTIRPIYEAEELEAMFRVASDYEATLVKFLLCSGLLDQEIRFLLWRDVDFRANLVRVTAKPQWEFTPKNWEERVIVSRPNGS